MNKGGPFVSCTHDNSIGLKARMMMMMMMMIRVARCCCCCCFLSFFPISFHISRVSRAKIIENISPLLLFVLYVPNLLVLYRFIYIYTSCSFFFLIIVERVVALWAGRIKNGRLLSFHPDFPSPAKTCLYGRDGRGRYLSYIYILRERERERIEQKIYTATTMYVYRGTAGTRRWTYK